MLMPTLFRNNFMDDVFDDFFRAPFASDNHFAGTASMKTDITETDNGYRIDMDLPGFSKEDVNAELKDGYMTITAEHNSSNDEKDTDGKVIRRERFQGVCKRSFYVGDQVTEEDIKAKFTNGVLTLDVPKKEPKPQVETKKYIAIE